MLKHVNYWTPRTCDGYGIDAQAELRFARPATGWWRTPSPPLYGSIQSLLPFFNAAIQRNRIARPPYGPGVTTVPTNTQNVLVLPQLPKQGIA